MPIPAPPISLLLAGGSWPPPTCVDSHVVLVVGGAGEAPAAARLWTHVGPLARVRPDVNLADVGRGKGAATAHEGALEGTLTCMDRAMWVRPATMQPPGVPWRPFHWVVPLCSSSPVLLTCVCADVFLQVPRGFEGFATQVFWTLVRFLTCVCSHMALQPVPCPGQRPQLIL